MQTVKLDLLNSAILIIEDDFIGRTVLREIFNRQGFTNIEEAENGRQALEKINSFRPDLVIMDVIMPEMDGIECCRHIRSNPDPNISSVPILFQTSLDGSAEKSSFFAAGASDYLCKPIDPHELTARAIVHLDREVILKSLKNYKGRMAQELDMARATQRVLIPSQAAINDIQKDYGLKIDGHYEASSELGGDFWGFKSISQDELAIYMVDFAGHGVNAALNVFRLHTLMQAAMDTVSSPSLYLTSLNNHLSPLLSAGQFATMFYAIINTRSNTLSYASAAAPDAVIFRRNGSYDLLESTGTVLGAFPSIKFKMGQVDFQPGDSLLIYSDALIETADSRGNMIPIDYWVDFYLAGIKDNNNNIFNDMLSDFGRKCSNNLRDDLTLSCYTRNFD